MRFSKHVTLALLIGCGVAGTSGFAAGQSTADAQELISVLQTNRPAGMTSEELNAALASGIFSALSNKVMLAGSEESGDGQRLVKTEMFERNIVCLRMAKVNAKAAAEAAEALATIAKSNKIQGVVLDLRYATGQDYASAAKVVDLFLGAGKPLMDWGEGMKNSTAAPADIRAPAAVLVNEQTFGAAEALAAAMRDSGAGLVFGTRSSGAAAVMETLKLSSGQALLIASSPIQLGSGGKLNGPVKPDIQVEVNPEDQRTYYADAFAVIVRTNQGDRIASGADSSTNRVSRRTRFNEADLVREHSSRSRQESVEAPEREPDAPVVNDPVLARALDVLKGLAVVRSARN